MKRFVAVVLISVLIAPPIAVAQQPGSQSDWSRVQQLEPGADITLTVKDRPSAKARVLFAGGTTLITLAPANPKLPKVVESALLRIETQWPAVLDGRYAVQNGLVRVSKQDGIVNGSAKVADLAQAVQQTPREDIREIRGPVRHRGSRRNAAILAVVGGVIGLSIAGGLASKECGGSCSGEEAGMVVALVGLPVGLGLAGYFSGSHTGEGIVYQAPLTAGVSLDDVPWERLRLALPPSLQGAEAAQKPATNVRPSPAPSGGTKGSPWSVTF